MTESQPGRVLQVLGLPASVDEELLTLYFENRRRSGGGPLLSVDIRADAATLLFEDPEAAARVLSNEHHVVHNVELSVRRPASKDPCRFLLKGLNPSTSIETIELYVENLMNLNLPDYKLFPSADRTLILIQTGKPLAQDFQRLSERISKRRLHGSAVTLEEVTETDAVCVENVHPGTVADVLSQYFEGPGGGAQRVKEVVMLTEGSAKVTFVSFDSVGLVLGHTHNLEGTELVLKPYFDFLQPKEVSPSLPLPLPEPHPSSSVITNQASVDQDDTAMQISPIETPILASASSPDPPVEVMEDSQTVEVQNSTEMIAITNLEKLVLFQKSTLQQDTQRTHPDYNITIENEGLFIRGPKGTEMDEVKCTLMEFFSNITELTLTLELEKAQFLAQKDVEVRLMQMINQTEPLALYTLSDRSVVVTSVSEDSARHAASLLESQVCSFSMRVDPEHESMLYCREWQEFCQDLGFVKVAERGADLDVITLKGMEQEKQAAILTFLTTPMERETFIQMEPGRLKYIQRYSHQLLADMTEVSIIPMETGDVCGLKIHGHPTACQIAEELLQGLVNDICTKTITVIAPGVTRYWQTEESKKMFHNMETRFHVSIFPEMVPWEPPTNQDMLECAWKLMADKNFVTRPPAIGLPEDAMQTENAEGNTSLINEAKKIVSVTEESLPRPLTDRLEDLDSIDLYTAEEPADALSQESAAQENSLENGATGFSRDLEEEAQLSLAIQYSMESCSQWSAVDEDAQLQKALELSKDMIQETQSPVTPTKRTLQDTIQSTNVLNLVVFANYNSDLIRVDIAFNKRVTQSQDKQKLEHRCLRYMSDFHKTCLDVIRRNHAVQIELLGTIITVSGFKRYVEEAMPNVKLLLEKIADSLSDKEILKSGQWFHYDSDLRNKTPYPSDLNILIELACRMRRKTLEVTLDNQPHTFNIARMDVKNNASGENLIIAREVVNPGEGADAAVPEEDYSLLSNLPEATRVDEQSDEFQTVVKNFYETIQQWHSKVRIIKVDKLMNKLLYSQYQLKKASVEQAAVYPQVERTLYHGTSESSVKEICVHGFNRSFCGKNATVYGQGVYFAVNSSLSIADQYSPPNIEGHKFIFVAKVLTGDYTKGDHSMKTAPLKETGEIPLRYDSVTDNITKPSMFIIFNDTQAFPEYLITCKYIYR